jgi:hypothetical protein
MWLLASVENRPVTDLGIKFEDSIRVVASGFLASLVVTTGAQLGCFSQLMQKARVLGEGLLSLLFQMQDNFV